MSKGLTILPALAVAAALSLPSLAWAEPDADTVVARVNGTEITLGHMIIAHATLPQQYQQPAADAMEAAFSLPADDPLAGEPGEPFDLTLWRGGVGETSKQTVKIRVRAYARRLAPQGQ